MKSFFNRLATLTGSRPFATFTSPKVPESTLNESFRSPLTPIIPSNNPRRTPRTFTDFNTRFPAGLAARTRLSPGFGRPFPANDKDHTTWDSLLLTAFQTSVADPKPVAMLSILNELVVKKLSAPGAL